METSKIKNIMIIILVILNLFLAGVVITDGAQNAVQNKNQSYIIEQILEQNGISIGEGVDLSFKTPMSYTITRDRNGEGKKAKKLVGTDEASDTGGSASVYLGPGGQAVFRGTGEFEFVMNAGAVPIGEDVIETAHSVMNKLGYSYVPDLTRLEQTDAATTVTVVSSYGGLPVYNANSEFTFTQTSLVVLSGTSLEGASRQDDENTVSSLYDSIMTLLSVIQESGTVCSMIKSIEAGYIISYTALGEATLTPVWHFVTDTFEQYINASTQRIENIVG